MSATAQTGYFFMPEHIILVGASERPHSLGERIFSHLLGSSYQGKITPVNLRHSSVAGIPSYSSLSKIPGQADLVVAVIPQTITTRCSKPAVKKTCATLS
ncbi:CoA-binding protein [Neisseria subflava]|uniref:CoA-binding protein n=1 Tax=Neisseria subflava TaxID=28449 RepID=UPI0020B647D1|nr:CoA-binding protein [Neisseria subflava]